MLRGAWGRSRLGVDLDQSLRLEPAQLAGFVQSYKTLFPSSLVGQVGGAHLEHFDLSLERRLGTGTYLAAAVQRLESHTTHHVGVYRSDTLAGEPGAHPLNEQLRFREHNAEVSLRQLLGDCFTFGALYRVSEARLTVRYPDLPFALTRRAEGDTRGLLHRVTLQSQFRHPTGLFAGADAHWWSQDVADRHFQASTPAFWQIHFYGGYRFPRDRAELTLGLLNATAQDYRLYPVNFYPDLPRERTFFARISLNF